MKICDFNDDEKMFCYVELSKYASKKGLYFDHIWDRKQLKRLAKKDNIEFDSNFKIIQEGTCTA